MIARVKSGIPLDRLERWWMEVVTHPGGVQVAQEIVEARRHVDQRIDAVIEPSRALSSEDRLAIYADGYFLRLHEVLEGDYPIVKFVLGDDGFRRLARDYVTACPPSHYSLNFLGEHLSRFVRDGGTDVANRAFVAELARLERAVEDVFDAPQREPLGVDEILAVSPHRWAEARFSLIPALRLLAFDHPVNAFVQARRDERHMDVPAPERSWVAVFRRDYRVWRLPLEEAQHAVLAGLDEGKTLGEALEGALAALGGEPEEFLGALEGWFRDWAVEGLFAAVEVGTPGGPS